MVTSESQVVGVNWSVFAESEVTMLQEALKRGHHEHLAALLVEVSPEKADEIEKIQQQLRPREFKFDSDVQKEFEIWLSEHQSELTPEVEAEWQAKIEAERAEKLALVTGGVVQNETSHEGGTTATNVQVGNSLYAVEGLGKASIDKLVAAGITTVDQLKEMTVDESKKILNPLVTAKIKHILKK